MISKQGFLSQLKRRFVIVWFNDYFRILGIVFGGHLLITGPITYWVLTKVGHVKSFNECLWISYAFVFMLAYIFNDYSTLRKYGLNEYGEPLLKKEAKRR